MVPIAPSHVEEIPKILMLVVIFETSIWYFTSA